MNYNVKLFLVPLLARIRHFFGSSWQSLGDRYGKEVMVAQAKEITANPNTDTEKASEPLDVIFLTMIGGHGYNTAVDIVLGLALKARGHIVRYVVCDQQLSACEVKKDNNKQDWASACSRCWGYGNAIYSKFGLDVIRVSDLVRDRQAKGSMSRWNEIVEASLLKHYGVGVLGKSPEVEARRKEYQASVAKSHLIGEAIVEMSPDRVLMSHGIYSTWGPQLNLLNEAEIPVVTFSKCKKQHTEKFNWKTSADWWDVSNEWDKVKDEPLSADQNELLDEYLDSRRSHSSDTLRYNFGDEESKEETFLRLGLDANKTTFVAYTNVLWDAASAQREIVFNDPINWIFETIQWFADNPELQLVVKVHPAEVVIGTNQPFAEIIKQQIPELPPNVRLIEPHEKVNSWSIMQISDLGIVHTSTVGMEMPLEEIPCMTVSKTHFRNRGFTVDVETRDEYFEVIKNWDLEKRSFDLKTTKEFARRYAFLLFERYQLPFRFFHEPTHTDVRAMNFKSVAELAEHPVMQIIIDSIENKKEFLLPNDPSEIERHRKT